MIIKSNNNNNNNSNSININHYDNNISLYDHRKGLIQMPDARWIPYKQILRASCCQAN